MATIRDLIPNADVFPALDGVWYGKIIAPVPTTTAQLMNIVIPDISADIAWKGCRWPKSSLSILAVGKEVLVVFDNRQQLWVIGVW